MLHGWNWRSIERLTIRDVIYRGKVRLLHAETSRRGTFRAHVQVNGCGGSKITVRDRFGNRASISLGPKACY